MQEIPFVVYDSGGVTEMIDPVTHDDLIVWAASPAGLTEKLNAVLKEGSVRTAVLTNHILTGKKNNKTNIFAYDSIKCLENLYHCAWSPLANQIQEECNLELLTNFMKNVTWNCCLCVDTAVESEFPSEFSFWTAYPSVLEFQCINASCT